MGASNKVASWFLRLLLDHLLTWTVTRLLGSS